MSEPKTQSNHQAPSLSSLLKEGIAVAKKIRPLLIEILEACEKMNDKPEHCSMAEELIDEVDAWVEKVVEYAISRLDDTARRYNTYKKRKYTWKAKTPRGYM